MNSPKKGRFGSFYHAVFVPKGGRTGNRLRKSTEKTGRLQTPARVGLAATERARPRFSQGGTLDPIQSLLAGNMTSRSAQAAFDFATWVAIASIKGGERQS
jgi:hypothetical protein